MSFEHLLRNRVRLFLRHTWLVTILGTLSLVGTLWLGFWLATRADHMRVAADANDAKFVQALAQEIARGHHDLTLRLVRTVNAEATAEAMSSGQADLAILPSINNDPLNWPVVAILRQNVMALIVLPTAAPAEPGKAGAATASAKPAKSSSKPAKAAKSSKAAKGGKSDKNAKTAKAGDSDDSDSSDDDSKSGKVTDLAGKRVGIVTGNEATPELLERLLHHYGVSTGKVTVSEIDPKNLAEAVKNNQVDVLFVADAATGQAISSAVAAATRDGQAPSFIGIDQADGIAKRHSELDSVDVDAGTFGGNPPMPGDDLKTIGFAEYLVARKTYDAATIAALSKIIYSSRQALAAALPGEIKIAAPPTDKDAAIVAHPGTLAYLSDSQQSFFDRYGDDIFYGMLIFPVFGSAIAAVAGYLRSNTRTRRLRLLQRVLDLVRKAHAAQTLETIEHLQIDADNLVIAIVHHSEHEEFDDTVRMSFTFALDQLRFAIAARRNAILDRSGATPGARIVAV